MYIPTLDTKGLERMVGVNLIMPFVNKPEGRCLPVFSTREACDVYMERNPGACADRRYMGAVPVMELIVEDWFQADETYQLVVVDPSDHTDSEVVSFEDAIDLAVRGSA